MFGFAHTCGCFAHLFTQGPLCAGLLVFAWLTAVLVKANEHIRRQAAQKRWAGGELLLVVAFVLAVHVPGVLWLLRGDKLWNVFVFYPPQKVETVCVEHVGACCTFASVCVACGAVLYTWQRNKAVLVPSWSVSCPAPTPIVQAP
jgi:hypothetical protein